LARADGTNSEIKILKGARIMLCSETEGKTREINTATLKNLSGEKKIMYRGLFQDAETTNVTWTMFLLTNDRIKLPNSEDHGLLRRFVYVPFEARFISDPTKLGRFGNRVHYLADRGLSAKLEDYGADFMNLLLNHYEDGSIEIPEWIRKDTDRMIKEMDPLRNILDDRFEDTPNQDYGLSWADVKRILRDEPIFRTLKFSSDTDLLDKVEKRLGKKMSYSIGGSLLSYISTANGDEARTKSRRVFLGLKTKIQDIEDYD
jgi:hypothetical protein